MVPVNINKPTQMKANDSSNVTIAASLDVRKFVAIVAGIMSKGKGANAYDVAIKISLKLPSPSINVVKHQLPITQSIRGTITEIICINMLEYLPVGLNT
jgi:hypothetical protein